MEQQYQLLCLIYLVQIYVLYQHYLGFQPPIRGMEVH